MQTIVYTYNGLVFFERDDARNCARAALVKTLCDKTIEYVWETTPIVTLEFPGIIWRGYAIYRGVRFSADIIEHMVA